MSWLSSLSPMPGFPDYTGPYKVGSADFEVPIASLDSPAPAPDTEVTTVAFRIYYPCDGASADRPVRWLAYPHRGYVQAFAQFLGAGNIFAQLFSYFPHLFYYANIPVRCNAQPLDPKSASGRWPTMIFSHGLGGSRNSYSHICGTLASHGIVVVAPEHRDGSSPVTYLQTAVNKKPRPLYYRRMTHTPSQAVYDHRDNQLKVRLWELGLIHDAMLKIDSGLLAVPPVLSQTSAERGELAEVLANLAHTLDMHEPGRLIFAGHSFGAATCVQFTKSIYYNLQSNDPDYHPLYEVTEDAEITRQVTTDTPLLLLDMWGMPLRSPSTEWLWSQPLPCYDSPHGGSNAIHILSSAFVKWQDNLTNTRRILSQDPTHEDPVPASERTRPAVPIFYPSNSAHLSQSDFGILFPTITRMAFKADEPERLLVLNARAMLQVLRQSGYDVAESAVSPPEEYDSKLAEPPAAPADAKGDWRILAADGGGIRGWVAMKPDEGAAPESSDSDDSDGEAGVADAMPRLAKTKSGVDVAGMAEGEVLGEVVPREQQ